MAEALSARPADNACQDAEPQIDREGGTRVREPRAGRPLARVATRARARVQVLEPWGNTAERVCSS